jgi:hypothetical protein
METKAYKKSSVIFFTFFVMTIVFYVFTLLTSGGLGTIRGNYLFFPCAICSTFLYLIQLGYLISNLKPKTIEDERIFQLSAISVLGPLVAFFTFIIALSKR